MGHSLHTYSATCVDDLSIASCRPFVFSPFACNYPSPNRTKRKTNSKVVIYLRMILNQLIFRLMSAGICEYMARQTPGHLSIFCLFRFLRALPEPRTVAGITLPRSWPQDGTSHPFTYHTSRSSLSHREATSTPILFTTLNPATATGTHCCKHLFIALRLNFPVLH